ncbi:unnamed protein product, partial [marine sediment metagenome]
IKTNTMCLSFPCIVTGTKCVVSIPVLDFIEKTTFNYHIEVIVDGYFFEASKGIVSIVGTSEVYTTQPKVKLKSSTNTGSVLGGEAKKSQDRMDKKEESSPSTVTDNAKKIEKVVKKAEQEIVKKVEKKAEKKAEKKDDGVKEAKRFSTLRDLNGSEDIVKTDELVESIIKRTIAETPAAPPVPQT